MFEIGDVVRLDVDIPKFQLKAGMFGTVVHIHNPKVFEIELMDDPDELWCITYPVYGSQVTLAWSVRTEQWLIKRPNAVGFPIETFLKEA